MRIVLDTAILVRGHGSARGLGRDLLLTVIASDHVLILSNEMVFEVARVLRYPRMLAHHGLSEERIYDFICFLRDSSEIVTLNPLLVTPTRDVNDLIVMQTAVVGDADMICTRDRDFFDPPADAFLKKAGIAVLDDISLMRLL